MNPILQGTTTGGCRYHLRHQAPAFCCWAGNGVSLYGLAAKLGWKVPGFEEKLTFLRKEARLGVGDVAEGLAQFLYAAILGVLVLLFDDICKPEHAPAAAEAEAEVDSGVV